MQSFVWEVKHAFRTLLRHRFVSCLVILCLTVAISIGLTVFSLVDTILLSPIPGISEPSSVASITTKPQEIPGSGASFRTPLSYRQYQEYRARARPMLDILAYQPISAHVGVSQETERVDGLLVSDNYFTVLGVHPLAGSLFSEQARASQEGVVLSARIWRRLFGDRTEIVGDTIEVNNSRQRVLGVVSEGFQGASRYESPEFYLLIANAAEIHKPLEGVDLGTSDRGWLLWFAARAQRPDFLTEAQELLDSIHTGLQTEGLDLSGLEVHPRLGLRSEDYDRLMELLTILGLVVGLIFTIACLNVGTLLITRLFTRDREMGVSVALGATPGRLVGRLMLESLVLGLLAGAGATLLFVASTAWIETHWLPALLPDMRHLVLRPMTLWAALGLSVVAGLLPGLIVTWRATRSDIASYPFDGPGRASHQRARLLQGMIVAQVTLSVVLVFAALLFARTFLALQAVDLGFEPETVTNFRFDLELERYPQEQGALLQEEILRQVAKMPQVESASLASAVPLAKESVGGFASIYPPDQPGDEPIWLTFNRVAGDYFRTLGVSLREGRGLDDLSLDGGLPPVVVNEALARLLWGDENPVGERLRIGEQEHQVVDVAGTVRFAIDRDPQPSFYLRLADSYSPQVTLHVRSREPQDRLIAAVRSTTGAVASGLPLYAVGPYQASIDRALVRQRFAATLVTLLGSLSLLVAALGIYGIVRYVVEQRRHEIGVRLSLGATRGEIFFSTIMPVCMLGGIAIVVGLAASLLVSRAFQSFLFGTPALDLGTLMVTGMLFLVVLIAGAAHPASRAAQLDPVEVLQS